MSLNLFGVRLSSLLSFFRWFESMSFFFLYVPFLSSLHSQVFGCVLFVYIHSQLHGKLDPKVKCLSLAMHLIKKILLLREIDRHFIKKKFDSNLITTYVMSHSDFS